MTKMLSRFALGMAAALAVGGVALGQTCRPVTVETARLNVESLKLYDMSGQANGWAPKASLPAMLNATDCNDPNYVMIEVAKVGHLVRKSDLTMPPMDAGCYCPASKPPNIHAAPGMSDLKVCPVAQCKGR